jgi:hypothetical protein
MRTFTSSPTSPTSMDLRPDPLTLGSGDARAAHRLPLQNSGTRSDVALSTGRDAGLTPTATPFEVTAEDIVRAGDVEAGGEEPAAT